MYNLQNMTTALTKPIGVPAVHEENQPVSIFDKSIPNSVWNMVNAEFRARMEKLDLKLWGLGEHELRKKIKPNFTLERLRISFWYEHQAAMNEATKMRMERIYAGVVANEFFYQVVLPDARNLAWILTPPASYTTALHATLNYGLDRIREVFDIPFKDAKGKWNTKAVDAFLKALIIVDNRVKGVPIQRVEMKGMHVHKNIDATLPPGEDMEQLQNRLNWLRQEQRKLERKKEEMGVELGAGDGELTLEQRAEAEVVMNKYAGGPHKNAEKEVVQLESNATVQQPGENGTEEN